MSTIISRGAMLRFAAIVLSLLLVCCLMLGKATAQSAVSKVALKEGEFSTEPGSGRVAKHPGPVDKFDRGVPRTSIQGFFEAAHDSDYERAARYLDLRNLPRGLNKNQGPELARQLRISVERAGLWIDFESVSTNPQGHKGDGLPAYLDSLGQIKTPKKTVEILLQRVPRKDGVLIWKVSNKTVADITLLYRHFGYKTFEEDLSKLFPDVQFLGWQVWQWAFFLVLTAVAYLFALVPTWLIGVVLERKDTEMGRLLQDFVTGPCRIILWLLFARLAASLIGPSMTIRSVLNAGTLLIITFAFVWASMRLIDILFNWYAERLRQIEKESAIVLLQPVKNIAKIMIAVIVALLWLDNIGFNIGTILAGLGVGGLAVALAAQDTLKNFFGTIMIFLDKPYQIGQRIVVKGHDGVVEEIGLRSTKMRLLTGHQTTVPNDEMAKIDIENIGLRPHIRRLTNIALAYDTPVEKAENAVKIIEDILEDHEGMDPKFPPRVYFNEFNRDSLNILVLYWYHPPAYWNFLAFNQRVNTQIMREFEKEGIRFAFPTSTTYAVKMQRMGGAKTVMRNARF